MGFDIAWLSEPSSTWEDAERLFPGCSAHWDADGGPEWLGTRSNITIVIHSGTLALAIGCGASTPYGWALWSSSSERWIFL